jgi:hypothetical protein
LGNRTVIRIDLPPALSVLHHQILNSHFSLTIPGKRDRIVTDSLPLL